MSEAGCPLEVAALKARVPIRCKPVERQRLERAEMVKERFVRPSSLNEDRHAESARESNPGVESLPYILSLLRFGMCARVEAKTEDEMPEPHHKRRAAREVRADKGARPALLMGRPLMSSSVRLDRLDRTDGQCSATLKQ
eukprot:scaffold3097_cov31-Prasinocladus_malaysianus.AAC.3